MSDIKNYALVTGGTSGIGLELCKLLAEDGYNLIIVARYEPELEATARLLNAKYGVDVRTYAKDLFNPDNAFMIYDDIKSSNVDVDILINDAGHGQYGLFTDTDLRKELDIINLNISSVVVLTKLFLRDMVARRRGRIMNLSSIAGKSPGPWQAVYHATKAFVQSFTEAVRSEVADTGVTITALLPGATATDFFNKAGMNSSKLVQESKLADPAEVAKDGYKALMEGDDQIVSGMKNKFQVIMTNMMPDAAAAERMKKMQEPAHH